jgi:GT2 family glycosyltransferase
MAVSKSLAVPPVSILVLNYNGKQHLQECLSSALVSARRYDGDCAVVCVDNRSTDGSRQYVADTFPDVEIVDAPANDFLFSLNAVVAGRPEEIAIIVNNDMRFDPDFVSPLVAHFRTPDVFAVGAAILDWSGSTDTIGPRCARIRHCWFYKWWQFDYQQQAAFTLEACAGAVAYRRSMFLELGGFDSLYRPGYYEDLDLSYRGWAKGWKVIYEPRSRAFHKISASMKVRHGQSGQDRLFYRNHLLFTAKNVGGLAFLIGFLLLLPLRATRPVIRGDWAPLMGFARALPALPRAIARRFRASGPALDLGRFETVTPLDTAHG